MAMANKFHQILKSIGKACGRTGLTEAEIEKIFQEKEFYLALGYEGIGRDILAQRSRGQKRYDTALTGFGGRVRAVIEFKKPEAGRPLEEFTDDLRDKYVIPHAANIGVLTDGVELILYYRMNGDFGPPMKVRFDEVTEKEAQKLEQYLKKRKVELDSLPSVLGWFHENLQGLLRITDSESEPARIFYQVFQLRPESVFGRLVLALWEILPKSIAESGFTRGSYEFWRRTYAREWKLRDVPQSWRAFALTDSAEVIARFSFALETAYTIISRLVLAKAADDRRFPHVRFLPRLQESYSELSVRERLKAEHHLEVMGRTFHRAGETLFHSIFSQDIFDWWVETKGTDNRLLCLALGEALLTVVQFYFADLSGDLFGDLYQHYFDRDTRKALGEFYTPGGAIEFILDECGYKGKKGERLLDPACGSGSFLVAALRRYLEKNKGRGKQDVLSELTDGLSIVGFDINPFAVLMAQVNYAALILPAYAEAVFDNPDFRILRLPVFRTDSLRIEERDVEADTEKRDKLTINMQFGEKTLDVRVYLPLLEGKKKFVEMRVQVPRFAEARRQELVNNLEEYVAALAIVFQAARDSRNGLAARLKARFGERAEAMAAYLQEALAALNSTVAVLKGKYNDGRFLKTIEDLVLAVSLKHDLQYDFVVGNPPYVRIQKIPEHVKEYWEGKYEWTERNYDLYVPFMERAVQSAGHEGWLKESGKLGFILSDRFLNVDYGAKLREELPKKLRLDLLIDFRDTRVFEGALNYPAILVGERSSGNSGEMVGARVFSSDKPFAGLLEEFGSLRQKLGATGMARGDAMEAFKFARERLRGEGWWLMPQDEAAVFDGLRKSSGKKLAELTASASGGFAGYQTSADSILVFDEVEDRGKILRLRPRHEPEKACCGSEAIEIEKEALRPFLFGKDVKRWLVDWKKTWVLFPYDVYAKKESLYDEKSVAESWNLIPSRENIDDFGLVNPDEIETMEERFPKAWKHLRKHEAALRAREHGRYDIGKTDGAMWYGAARPQNLDYYFREKLLVQLLSRSNSIAYDPKGKFVFQAGGKGGGVYGIVIEDGTIPRLMQAYLCSRTADFLLKQVSSVYGGRFYSYADQFLKDLPVANSLLAGSGLAQELDKLPEKISSQCAKKHELAAKLKNFPESFAGELTKFELDTVKRLSDKGPAAEQLKIEREEIRVEERLYGFAAEFGRQGAFEFEALEHAECVAEGLRCRERSTIGRKEVLEWAASGESGRMQEAVGVVGQSAGRTWRDGKANRGAGKPAERIGLRNVWN